MAGWLRESWRRLCERVQLCGCETEKLQESKVHFSKTEGDIPSEGGQERSQDDIVTAIEKSKVHWSEISGDVHSQDGSELDMANFEIRQRNECSWKALQDWDRFFFQDWGKIVKIGRKIGEGGQAQIYEAQICEESVTLTKLVVKVFNLEGCSLEDLICQWPRISSTTSGMDLEGCEQSPQFLVATWKFIYPVCQIFGAYLLEDGRFAFVMACYRYDLRSYIDKKMQNNNGPPFSNQQHLIYILLCIARGMQWLHCKDVLHQDLKASNVLIGSCIGRVIYCDVADYECSMSTIGTGFWRAPEILQEIQNGSSRNVDMWTKKSDVYSFEVLTSRILLSGCSKKDWDDIIHHGRRPELPDYVDSKLQHLVKKCWDEDPLKRPSFDDIVNELVKWDWKLDFGHWNFD